MKRIISALAAACWMAGVVASCGGIAADGGQSGTGISAIRGNVVAGAGTALDVADIRVVLTGAAVETRTDGSGRFELHNITSGTDELRFERSRDGLSARTDVVIPAGGVLELVDVVLDPESNEAEPTMRRTEFEGFIEALNCGGGTISVVAKEDQSGTIFTVELASATIRHGDVPLACGDLLENDRVQIEAETADGLTLTNADVVLEDREDEPDDTAGMPDDETNGDGHQDDVDDDGGNDDGGDDDDGDVSDDEPGDNDASDDGDGLDDGGTAPGDDGQGNESDDDSGVSDDGTHADGEPDETGQDEDTEDSSSDDAEDIGVVRPIGGNNV